LADDLQSQMRSGSACPVNLSHKSKSWIFACVAASLKSTPYRNGASRNLIDEMTFHKDLSVLDTIASPLLGLGAKGRASNDP
jgi:hypothetical protein